jgi:hypothetical protein
MNKKIEKLLKIREDFLNEHYVKPIGDNPLLNCVHQSEKILLALPPEQKRISLWIIPNSFGPTIVNTDGGKAFIEDYFDEFERLADEEKAELWQSVQEQTAALRGHKAASQPPDEKIFKNVTKVVIEGKFSKAEAYTTKDVADTLGLTYMQTYQNVIPWMRNHGYTVS